MFAWFKRKYKLYVEGADGYGTVEHLRFEEERIRAEKIFEAELPTDDREPGLDISSPTWKYIEQEVKSMLGSKRKFNDRPMDETKTALIRGDIRTLKSILELPKKQAESNRPGIISRHDAGEEEV